MLKEYSMRFFRGAYEVGEYVYRAVRFGEFSVNPNTEKYWDKKFSKMGEKWRDVHYTKILDLFPKDEEFSVMDLGCGIGDGCELMAEAFPKAKVTGIDFSSIAINKAKARPKKVDYHVLDVLKEDFKEDYDYITILQTLEHFSDPFAIVDKCLKRCRKAVIVTVPYSPAINGKMSFLSEHRYCFNEETFKKYKTGVVKVTDYIEETKSRCIIYEILK